MFRAHVLIIRRSKLHYTASGIITPIGVMIPAPPGRTSPPGKTRYPFCRRRGGPQARSGRAENLVPTGIRSRTVQPVAQSLYGLNYSAQTHRVSG